MCGFAGAVLVLAFLAACGGGGEGGSAIAHGILTALGLWWAHSATREPTERVTPEPAPAWETVEPGY